MATITEDYVSFETAKLLKEKGFEQYKCPHSYNSKGVFQWSDNLNPYEYSAPTQAMTMKWLRKIHNLCLFVIPATIDETFITGVCFNSQCDSKWEWCASKNNKSKATFGFNINRKYCDSYEQACEAAIKYCLENLI